VEYGDPGWWPAETPFEVAVGAILTQRASWRNVELAIESLRNAGSLTPAGLLRARREELEQLIRPVGFYRQKTRYLLEFASFIDRDHDGNITSLSRMTASEVRKELLRLPGIGPETADSILLYALGFPTFVVDAYTMRLLERMGIDAGEGYESVKKSFEDSLDGDCSMMARAHALIVVHCKSRCKSTPVCNGCPFIESCISEAEKQK